MTDRELLEAAAKASGIEVMRSRLDDPMQRDMLVRNSARNMHHENGAWNPLTDDGDALRLAVKLRIDLHQFANNIAATFAGLPVEHDDRVPCSFNGADRQEAARRAIVCAAAAMAQTASA